MPTRHGDSAAKNSNSFGLDIAKSVFQIHGVNAAGAVVMRKRITRAWSRQLQALGHIVLTSPMDGSPQVVRFDATT
jgi:hypothetical protein